MSMNSARAWLRASALLLPALAGVAAGSALAARPPGDIDQARLDAADSEPQNWFTGRPGHGRQLLLAAQADRRAATPTSSALPGNTTCRPIAARRPLRSSSMGSCTPPVPGATSMRSTRPPAASCGASSRRWMTSTRAIPAATWSIAALRSGRARSTSPRSTVICMRSTPPRVGRSGTRIPSSITSCPTPAPARRRSRATWWSSATAAPTWVISPFAATLRPTTLRPVHSNGASARCRHRRSASRTRIRNWPRPTRPGMRTARRNSTAAARSGTAWPTTRR